jgi:CRP-like cAMP-binding protein
MYANDDRQRISGILRKLPLFEGLYNDEYDTIRAICTPCQFPDGHLIFSEGDGSPCMYVVLAGKVEISTKASGSLHVLATGDIFGEIGLISQKRRSANARCLGETTLLRIDRDDFNLLLGKQPRISSVLMRNITVNLSNHILRMNRSEVTDYIPRGSANKKTSGPTVVNRRG